MIIRAVTPHTTLVAVSPMFVPQRRLGDFAARPSTTSPFRTNRSITHSVVTIVNTIQTKASYEILNGFLLRLMESFELWEECTWSSEISMKNPTDCGETLLLLEGGLVFLWQSSTFWNIKIISCQRHSEMKYLLLLTLRVDVCCNIYMFIMIKFLTEMNF